jgi:hypothetical protein
MRLAFALTVRGGAISPLFLVDPHDHPTRLDRVFPLLGGVMFEAHITSARGSLFYVAPATPYDLDTLRMHARDFAAVDDAVVVDVTLHTPTAKQPVVAVLADLADAGIATRLRASSRCRADSRRGSAATRDAGPRRPALR